MRMNEYSWQIVETELCLIIDHVNRIDLFKYKNYDVPMWTQILTLEPKSISKFCKNDD